MYIYKYIYRYSHIQQHAPSGTPRQINRTLSNLATTITEKTKEYQTFDSRRNMNSKCFTCGVRLPRFPPLQCCSHSPISSSPRRPHGVATQSYNIEEGEREGERKRRNKKTTRNFDTDHTQENVLTKFGLRTTPGMFQTKTKHETSTLKKGGRWATACDHFEFIFLPRYYPNLVSLTKNITVSN